jgi:hypothetical protein
MRGVRRTNSDEGEAMRSVGLLLAAFAWLLSARSGAAGDAARSDLALQVALLDLAHVPKGITGKGGVCVGLGEDLIDQATLERLSEGAPGLSLRPYVAECLVPVTELFNVTVWNPEKDGTRRVIAAWSRKADDTCFSEGIRRHVYVAKANDEDWEVRFLREETFSPLNYR